MSPEAQAAHTPGPWIVQDNTVGVCYIHNEDGSYVIARCVGHHPSYRADAALIAEAGTVTHETGLTPRQLAEQRAQLLRLNGKLG